ncbi:hypothetical protein FGO68_gene7175 [Halteria grandinella]|uniref:Uncharacterized protein n=1 Tax=Halteria grandinella TaxID=5974 RepID=A0A8J8T9S1_HALGN|nr:hypothetical protein FGO68_gene7175 [Halteria grandinella]
MEMPLYFFRSLQFLLKQIIIMEIVKEEKSKPLITLSLKKSHSTSVLNHLKNPGVTTLPSQTLTSKNSQFTSQKQQGSSSTRQITLQDAQKQAINRIIKELADCVGDSDRIQTSTERKSSANQHNYLKQVLRRPHIQDMFHQEFHLSQPEIIDLEQIIMRQCQDIITLAHNKHRRLVPQSARERTPVKTEQVKQQPLSLLQRKELERQLTLDFFQFPVQPCVRSLYYLSKIAQKQSLKIMVPPTVLLGFGDDNRIIYNDYSTGKLVVESKNISPKRIQQFISSHMVGGPVQQGYSIEDKLLLPKYVIKLASKGSTHNEIKLYYSRESLIADLLSFWGSFDLALQMFVKQKHPFRPSIHRCYVNKNGSVYKAMAINNQENITKDHKFYGFLKQMIEDGYNKAHNKSMSKSQSHARQPSESKQSEASGKGRERGSLMGLDRFIKENTANVRKRRSTLLNNLFLLSQKSSLRPEDNPYQIHEEVTLDKNGFPTSLAGFNLNDYYSTLQQSTPNSDLKRAFICTADYIDNLTMMNCRPSALRQAQQMTEDIYRLFSQYYLKIQKYGHISQFVCDFMEDNNGIMYLLQVKSFECEGVLHEWQMPFEPQPQTGRLITAEEIKEIEEKEMVEELEKQCAAKLVCTENRNLPQLKQWWIEALKEHELWPKEGTGKKGHHTHMINDRLIDKYQKEIEIGKDSCFFLLSEQQRISPLFPLITFCDKNNELYKQHRASLSPPPKHRHTVSHERKNSLQIFKDPILNMLQQYDPNFQDSRFLDQSKQEPEQASQTVKVCLSCEKVLELYQSRYYALVFKTEQTQEELRKLKLKLINHWTYQNISFLVKIYKDSKKSMHIVSDIDKIEKRAAEQSLRDRAKSPDSVAKRTIKNARPLTAIASFCGYSESRFNNNPSRPLTSTNDFDKMLIIDSKPTTQQSKRKVSTASRNNQRSTSLSRGVLKATKSLMKSIDRLHRHMETLQTTPGYEQSGLAVAMQFARPMTQESQMQTVTSYRKSQAVPLIEESPYGNIVETEVHQANGQNRFKNRAQTFLNMVAAKSFGNSRTVSGFSSSRKSNNKQQIDAPASSTLALINSQPKKSDKDFIDYFNNKRLLNKLQLNPSTESTTRTILSARKINKRVIIKQQEQAKPQTVEVSQHLLGDILNRQNYSEVQDYQ